MKDTAMLRGEESDMTSFRVLVASDLHLDTRTEAGQAAIQRAKAALGSLGGTGDLAQAVLLLGDLGEDSDRAGYDVLAAITAPFANRVLAVPGNHDDPALLAQAICPPPGPPSTRGHCRLITTGGTAIALSSSVVGAPHGELGSDDLAWLATVLDEAEGSPVVVGLHHSPLVTELAEPDAMGLRVGREEFVSLVQSYPGPVAVVAGHYHIARTCMREGVQYVLNPSLSGTPGLWPLWPQCDAIAPRANGMTALSLDTHGAWHVEFIGGW